MFCLFLPSGFFRLIYLPFYLGLATLVALDGTWAFYFNINFSATNFFKASGLGWLNHWYYTELNYACGILLSIGFLYFNNGEFKIRYLYCQVYLLMEYILKYIIYISLVPPPLTSYYGF